MVPEPPGALKEGVAEGAGEPRKEGGLGDIRLHPRALHGEERAIRQRMQATSRSWERQENRLSLSLQEQHSPAHLILAQ